VSAVCRIGACARTNLDDADNILANRAGGVGGGQRLINDLDGAEVDRRNESEREQERDKTKHFFLVGMKRAWTAQTATPKLPPIDLFCYN
jgi:hypothetical protein